MVHRSRRQARSLLYPGSSEDTKALSCGALGADAFLQQARIIFDERFRALKYLLTNDSSDLLFVYFMTVDQVSHMLWRFFDKTHPNHEPHPLLGDGILDTYRWMDQVIGHTRRHLPQDATLIVMSDHGYAPFSWGFGLNTWLVEQGYMNRNPYSTSGFFPGVNWRETKAYALGLNGLYLNLLGRENKGVVAETEVDELIGRLSQDLLAFVDPNTGLHPIASVTATSSLFKGPATQRGPDLIIGYRRGYRCSWETPLGGFSKQIIVENRDEWSGDHCIDPSFVPGVLLSNREITLDSPRLVDVTAAILNIFDIRPSSPMIGVNCLSVETREGRH